MSANGGVAVEQAGPSEPYPVWQLPDGTPYTGRVQSAQHRADCLSQSSVYGVRPALVKQGGKLAITIRNQGLLTSVTLEALFPDERSNNSLRHLAGFDSDHRQFGRRCRGLPVSRGQPF